VIGELKSRQRLGEQVQREFWRFSIGFLRNKLEEKLVRLIDLGRDATYEKLLYEVGPTDAGLISLAQKENCTLLTDDSRLLSWQRLDPHLHIELIKDVLHL
jgi:predicted nucleic acid-binding protein